MRLFSCFLISAGILPSMLCYRFLFFSPVGSRSHKIFGMGIVDALAERGHHVTVVSPFKPSEVQKNVREIVVPEELQFSTPKNVFEHSENVITKVLKEAPGLCSDILALKEIQDLYEEKFDLIMYAMIFDTCFLTFVHRLQIPFINVPSTELMGPLNDLMNNIDFPAIYPNKMIEAQYPLSFVDRIWATLVNILMQGIVDFYVMPRMESICRERGLCPDDMPSFKEISNKASLAITNSVRSFENPPRPMNPNIIFAGGVHIKPAKRLPEDLEKWIEGSGEEGFIFFSLGSALDPSLLPESYRKILVNVFGSLKQRVLWKWAEESMPNLPKNVLLRKWLPQSDVLGHPKLQLFITHGGILSTTESAYRGIPILGMPVMTDQFANMKQAEKEGWAKLMQWKDLEENALRQLILDTLNNKSLREISQQRSALLRDVPIPPAEEAAFWAEYVIRHKGAPHLMSATINMRWYEIYNMDVWALITGFIFCIFYIFFRILKYVFYKCLFTKEKSQGKRKNE